MTESFLNFSAPKFTVDGDDLPELTRDLAFMKVSEANDGMRTLEARFVAFGPTQGSDQDELMYLDGSRFDFGSEIKVEVGEESQRNTVFEGRVSAITAHFQEGQEPEVAICAEDSLMELRLSRRMQTYNNVTDAQIAEEIADLHGLNVEADAPGPEYDVVQQWNMSDLAFLRDRARRVQADVWLADGTLHFRSRAQREGAEITLVQGNHLLGLQACADLAHQRNEVRVSGYNANDREVIDESADLESIRGEMPQGRTGPEILNDVFGDGLRSYRVRDVPLNADEAQQWSVNEMLRRARSFVTVSGITRGTPSMSVGSRLRLERVGAPFEGPDYYVVKVCHSHELSRGYRTEFVAERAAVGVSS
jgi:phage protein D